MNDVISQIVVNRTTPVEINLTSGVAAKTTYSFKDGLKGVSKLQSMYVYAVEVITAGQQTASAQSFRALIPEADAKNIALTLTDQEDGNLQFIFKQPSTRFIPSLYNGYTQYIKPRVINWATSGITIVNTGTLTTSMTFLLNCYWMTPEEWKLLTQLQRQGITV